MNYTTYLFDFDYTLADSSRGIVTCFRNVLTRHGYTEVADEDIKRTIGKTLEDSFSILTGVTDIRQLMDFKQEYTKEADTHMTVNTVLFLETKSVLVALKDTGARIGIISTKYRYRIKELLDLHFPTNFMDIIVGGEDVKEAKPAPEGLLFAIKQLHASKNETLYIGDSTVDAETAQAAGVDFAGVTHGVTTAKELSKYPHWKIMSTLDELLENKEEQSPIFEIEKPICPEHDTTVSFRKKRRISIWQIILLLSLIWLSYEEKERTDSFFFAFIFLLTIWGVLQKRRILPDKAKALITPWWHPCTVRLRAFRLKLIRGNETPPITNETSVCQNCGTTYIGNYCNRCGQSRNTPRYRLSNALKNIAGGFFNIDRGFGRTLIDLLYRPGYLIRDFIGGKRIQYFRPFQTLFILAALYLMTVQLVAPEALNPKKATQQELQEEKKEKIISAQKKLQRKLKKATSEEEKKMLVITLDDLEKSLEKIQEQSTKDSATVTFNTRYEDKEEDFIDTLIENSDKMEDKIKQFIRQSPFLTKVCNLLISWGHGNKAFHIIITLPLFAFATQLAFRRKKYKSNYNTTEHIFIQAYIACQLLLLSIVILPFHGYARISDLYELPWWLMFSLFCLDYKQLYRCTWWKSFWRTIIMFIYSLILLILLAVLATLLAGATFYILQP